MMKRTALLAIALVMVAAVAIAQDAADTTSSNPYAQIDPEQLGQDAAQQRLQEISIEKFEDAGFWRVYMPIDQGVIESRRLEGSPALKTAIPAEEELEGEGLSLAGPDQYVLGVKASFFRRGNAEIYIQPIRPLLIPGITKTISLWVAGRNFNHRLSVVVADFFGNVNIISMGTLNFSGWRRLTCAVPPSVKQIDYHYSDRMGIQIMGFMIEPALMETYGTYYVYFDDLRAVTDLFADSSRDADDMVDSW